MSLFSYPCSEMNANRFAMLSMDDDELDEQDNPVAQVHGEPKMVYVEQPPITAPVPVTHAPRKWSVQEGRPDVTRQWNLDTEKPKNKRGPFSRYAFRDEDHARARVPRTYAFRDEESPSPEAQKPVTPVTPQYPTAFTPPPVDVAKEEDFPKLSEYMRPQTPPYPPDDGWYPTLAERVRLAIQRSDEEAAHVADQEAKKKVINMDTVIPMPTHLSKNLPIQ
jgi:hypothetical protein